MGVKFVPCERMECFRFEETSDRETGERYIYEQEPNLGVDPRRKGYSEAGDATRLVRTRRMKNWPSK